MRYDETLGKIKIAVCELVTIARRGISAALTYDEDEPSLQELTKKQIEVGAAGLAEQKLSLEFSADGIDYILDGSAYLGSSPDEITTLHRVRANPNAINRDTSSQIRAISFILGYILSEKSNTDSVLLRSVIFGEGERCALEERVEKKKLDAFFAKCKTTLSVYAKPEINRVTKRLPGLRVLKFPYPNIREGQSEFIRRAYKTLARGGKLYASAPTGTGKTISALYPALRALGDGRVDKAFYFTPKATTANAVRDALALIAERGAEVRAIILTAKEKICIGGSACKISRKFCQNSKCNKLPDALLELYEKNLTVVFSSDVQDVARKWRICPYELSLAYSELCDVVICDINYLFDPHVYIKRFFSSGGRYAFLVDEAHNLSERVREAYSAEISTHDLTSPKGCEVLGEASPTKKLSDSAERLFFDIVYPIVKEEVHEGRGGDLLGATHTSSIPDRFYTMFDEISKVVEREIFDNFGAKDEECQERLTFLRSFKRKIDDFAETLARFDDTYQMFVFFEDGALRVKLYCLDTGPIIKKRLGLGHGSVLFSATLSPLGYYREILGGDRSDEILEVNSPFAEEQLSVAIMDKISTRFSEREDTLSAVCRVIAATVSARRGNYMIFSPSFAYSEALYKAFSAKYPKLRIIHQTKSMSEREKKEFLLEFERDDNSYLIAFCVMGGIYSEGIDLAGERLIGAVIVGVGIPSLSYEREAIAAYYDERFDEGKQYAYIYPGMNRVFQSAGRVIRTESDRGVIVLIDDRFDDPLYKKSLPALWRGVKFISDAKELKAELSEFWQDGKDC